MHHHAKREQICARVHRAAGDLLRSHVPNGAQHRTERGHRRFLGVDGLDRLGEAEVEDLHHAIAGHEEVFRLQIAVHDVPVVGRSKAACRLDPEVDDGSLGELSSADEIPNGTATQKLGDEIQGVAVFSHVEQRHDVRVRERRDRAGLFRETLASRLIVGQMGRQHLDGHLTIESAVAGPIDGAHATRADRRDDGVPA